MKLMNFPIIQGPLMLFNIRSNKTVLNYIIERRRIAAIFFLKTIIILKESRDRNGNV